MAHVIGLDIGSYTAKAVLLNERGGKFSLVNFSVLDFGEEPIETMDPVQKITIIQSTVKQLIASAGFKVKNVAISLSGDQVIVRYIRLPYMTRDELKGVIRFEAEQYIPFSMDQVALDFSILGEVVEEGQKKVEVLLVAVKEELVNQYIQLLQGAGLNISLIDIDVLALHNALEANYEVKEGETVAIINMGGKFTNLSIVEDGVARFSRDIPIGGMALTLDISKEFGIGFAESEKLKREQGGIIIESESIVLTRIPSKEDKRVRIYSSISTTLGKLVMEIRRAFDFYESSSKKRTITKAYICGGTAMLQNVDKFLVERLKIPVEILNPLSKIEVKDIAAFDAKIKQYSAVLPVAIGLAVRKVK